MFSRTTFSLILALLLSAPAAHATEQTPGKCDAVLAKDSFGENLDSRLILSILQTLDENSYNQLKSDTNGGLTIPIEGVPISLTGSWDQFQQQRSQLNQTYQYNYDSTLSKSIAISSTSPQAIQAWSDCMQENTRQTLILRPRFQSDTDILVDVYWTPGAELQPGKFENLKISGGHLVGQMPKTFLAKWTTLEFMRDDLKKPFAVAINIQNGDSGQISFPPSKRSIFTSSLACREWSDNGCLTCVISITNTPATSFANIPAGGTKTYKCRGMVPSAPSYAELAAPMMIDGGGSQFDWVMIGLKMDAADYATQSITNTRTMNFTTKTPQQQINASGVVLITLMDMLCQWNDPVTTHLNFCSVSASPNSQITVNSLAPENLTHQSKIQIDKNMLAKFQARADFK